MVSKDRDKSAGFTLIEVMAALLIMSFGLLAMMAMSVAAVQGNTAADYVSSATILGDEVLEMIRANVDNINAYNGINTNDGTGDPTRPGDTANPVAASDYDTIEARLNTTGLPSGACAIVIQNNTPAVGLDTAQVTISWTRSGNHAVTFSKEFAAAR